MHKTTANDRSYMSYIEISGICWGASIILFLKFGIQSVEAIVMLLAAIAMQIILYAKKYRLQELKESELFALNERYMIIAMDFLMKYCVYGLGACILNIFVNPEVLSLKLNLQTFFLGLHLLFLAAVRYFYSTYATSERKNHGTQNDVAQQQEEEKNDSK